jgi:hypothetical protein
MSPSAVTVGSSPARAPRWAGAVAVAAAALALAGCAGASSTSGAVSAAAVPVAAGTASDAAGSVDSTGATSAADAYSAPLSTTGDRSIVVRADTTVRVDDVDAATAKLGTIAAGRRATIATQATTNGTTPVPIDTQSADGGKTVCAQGGCTTGYASSVTTLRLDNGVVDALLHDIAGLGTVEASSRTSDDVTAEVADVAARVSNARASLARVRALMTKAVNVAEVVALEGELSKREADLEALEARQRTLADQSAQATVTVTLLSTAAPVTTAEESGFLAGLRQGWTAFTSAMVAALTVLGALVPFLVVLAPLALLARWWWRRRRPSATPTLAGPEGPAAA